MDLRFAETMKVDVLDFDKQYRQPPRDASVKSRSALIGLIDAHNLGTPSSIP